MAHLLLLILTYMSFGFGNINCSVPKKNPKRSISLLQNESYIPIENDNAQVLINNAPFSLRFFCKVYDSKRSKFHAVRIAAFTKKENLIKLKPGMQLENTDCFSPGTGMAPWESGYYESLVFTNQAHHYLFYENETENRLKLIQKQGKYLELEFDINQFTINESNESITNSNITEFYLAILTDRNLNGRIDKGELKKLTIIIS